MLNIFSQTPNVSKEVKYCTKTINLQVTMIRFKKKVVNDCRKR